MKDPLHPVDDQRALITDRPDQALEPEQPVAMARDDLAEPRRQPLPIHRSRLLDKPCADRLVVHLVAAEADVGATVAHAGAQLRREATEQSEVDARAADVELPAL